MRATVGLSAEQTVVRGVLVSCTPEDGAPEKVLRTIEEQVADGVDAVPGVLDRIVAAVAPDIRIENVAVVYRTAEERRALVTNLSTGGWSSASLVSVRSALLAAVREVPGQEKYGPVLIVETVDRRTSFAVVDAARAQVLASDTWQPGIVGAESADAAVIRIRSQCDSPSTRPEAVLLCGAAAGIPAVAAAFDKGFGVPVLQAPAAATMAARGAALVASGQIEESDPGASGASAAGLRRPVLIAAAIVAVLGATGFAVAQIGDDHPAAHVVAESSAPAGTVPSTSVSAAASVSAAPTIEPVAPPETPAAAEREQIPAPMPPPAVPPVPINPRPTAPPRPTTTVKPEPAESAPQEAQAPAEEQAPEAPPAPSKVGEPDGNGLFPGESPPPAAGADPEVTRQWWDNHWALKQRWLNGG